jgi:O-antigen/teichoic acid export membrane protein
MAALKKLAVSFSHFVGGNVISLLLGLITFPILTRLLSREDYGILGLVTTTIAIAVAFAKGGISDGIIRLYKEHTDSPERLSMFTSTVLTRSFILSLVVTAIYLVGLPVLHRYLGIHEEYLKCFMIMGVYLLVRPMNIIVLNYLRATGKTFFYNVITVTTKTVSIVLALGLLIYVIHDLYGYFVGVALAEIVMSFILFRWLLTNYRFVLGNISGELTLRLVKFGIPLLLSEFSYLILTYVDRFMLVAYHGEAVLGLYSVGYNMASYLNDLVLFSLSYALVPMYVEMYVKEGKEKTEEFLGKCLNYFLIGIIPLCVGYYAVAKDLIIMLASNKYAESAVFSPLILLGLVFLGMNTILYAGLYLQKKTVQILLINFSAATVNIVMNIILLPEYQATGAAMATLIACITASVITVFLSFRYIAVKPDLKTIVYYLVLSWLMFLCINWIDTHSNWLNLLAKVALGAAIIVVGTLAREKELRAYAGKLYAGLRA